MRIQIAILLLAIISVSCNSADKENDADSGNEEQDSLHVESSIPDTALETIEFTDSVPLISGSCANGRDPGNRSQYIYKMTVGTSKTDSISVRSDASCFEIGACAHNIMGKIRSGTVVYTTSSLKNRGGSAGIAYAFLVRDKNGDTCRAYMSYMNFEEGLDFHNH